MGNEPMLNKHKINTSYFFFFGGGGQLSNLKIFYFLETLNFLEERKFLTKTFYIIQQLLSSPLTLDTNSLFYLKVEA